MTNKQLAKMIVDFLPFWELPYDEYKDNYKSTLASLKDKEQLQDIYDYLYNDENDSKQYKEIMLELEKRIKGE